MSKWEVESRSESGRMVYLVRPEHMILRVGDYVEIKPSSKRGGGNRGCIMSLSDHCAHMSVSKENRRTRYPGTPVVIGEFDVPYSAIDKMIY